MVGTKQYDAFGAGRAQSGVQLAFGYTGEQEDGESGLVYLRARYLDSASGRFLALDPLRGTMGDPASGHGYAYMNNGPLQWLDPRGLAYNRGKVCDGLRQKIQQVMKELQGRIHEQIKNESDSVCGDDVDLGHKKALERSQKGLKTALESLLRNRCGPPPAGAAVSTTRRRRPSPP